jgi:hypothetical protein
MNKVVKDYIVLILFLLVAVPVKSQQEVDFGISDGLTDSTMCARIEMNMKYFLQSLNENAVTGKIPKFPSKVYVKDADKKIEEMLKNSAMPCTTSMLKCRVFLTNDGGYQIRGIPVKVMAADEDKQNQEIVVEFNSLGLIDNVSISLENQRYKALMEEAEGIKDVARRQVIIDFVENFRTSYNRKDLKYLQQVYSDNALIITGRVVKTVNTPETAMKYLSQEKIKYITQTKKEYLDKLAMVFKATKFLNVDFSDIEIAQHPKYPDIYGVTLKQGWRTDRYSDDGYLFLMIDFKDELNPLIQVRTWQPTKFPSGKPLPRDQVFHLGSFHIVR